MADQLRDPYLLTEREKRMVLENSIERVINSAIAIAENSRHEFADINRQDWIELKWLVCKLWDRERNAILTPMLAPTPKDPK